MTIRFLQTVDSLTPGFPFMAGQVITVEQPPRELLAYLNDGRAEVLGDVTPERATVAVPRRARKAVTR
jgi:hypothetical protein